MAKLLGHPPQEFEIPDIHHITRVVFPESHDRCRATPQGAAKVTFQSTIDGTSFTMPVSMSSLSLLPSPQQREPEQEIKSLRAQLDTSRQSAKDDYRKWVEIVGELDNTRNQLKEVRVAKSRFVHANSCFTSEIQKLKSQVNIREHQIKELESRTAEIGGRSIDDWMLRAKGLEDLVVQLQQDKDKFTSEIQKLKSQVSLLEHQYASKCQAVYDLQTAGSAKERDEYSKALNYKDTQISQITKQAKEWKARAIKAEKVDAVDVMAASHSTVSESWASMDKDIVQAARERLNTLAKERSLNTRLADVEARVAKLEEAEGFPIETYNVPTDLHALLYMGGIWIQGVKASTGFFYSQGKPLDWDKANQPTRWKPMPT